MIFSNAHTHTQFCDAKSTAEEMVQSAISHGLVSLGFSGHSFLREDDGWTMNESKTRDYIEEVKRLRRVYGDRICLHLGIELDSHSVIDRTPFEYAIGSVHEYISPEGEFLAYDNGAEGFMRILNDYFDGNVLKLSEVYYEEVCRHLRESGAEILGHFNLITKYNKTLKVINEEDPAYRKLAGDALLYASEKAVVTEINTGAIGRGHADIPYPNQWMLDLLKEHNRPIMLTSDCHSASEITTGYDLAVEMAEKAGYTSMLILSRKEGVLFEETALE